MAAAMALTDPAQRGRYVVTVYQQGWRLGGKGAAGRNFRDHARIEEHGLHIWLGCYENAFRLMRQCYAELGRPASAPLGTIEQAFRAQSDVVLSELINGAWQPWALSFPSDRTFPGERDHLPTLWDYFVKVLEWIPNLLAPHAPLYEAPGQHVGHEHRRRARSRLEAVPRHPEPAHQPVLDEVAVHLARLRAAVAERAAPHLADDHPLRHAWILLDFGLAIMRGIIADGLFFGGYERINHLDFRDWLLAHGADTMTCASPAVAVLYELIFSFERGIALGPDARPSLEAGTIARALPRMFLGYTGAVMWLMQGGMGDTVFAPLYQVLVRRGVQFNFFHRVTGLRLAMDGSLGAVELSRQVKLNVGQYDPLVLVRDLPAWPATPRYEQLVEGAELRRRGINLESFYTDWRDTGGDLTLRADNDFDQVVLGIPLGALSFISGELAAASPAWTAMLQNVGTVQTQSLQLWLNKSLAELGYPAERVVSGTFDCTPLDTWADMSDVLPHENWGPDQVRRVVYFTGPMAGSDHAPPADRHDFPAQARAEALEVAGRLLEEQVRAIWPNFTQDAVVSRYDRWNIDPSERYVQTLADTSRYRLPAGASGFDGLFLAGDWVNNGLNMGCVEGAVMAGLQASRAISGFPTTIIGEGDSVW